MDIVLTYLNMFLLFVPLWYITLSALREQGWVVKVAYIIISAVLFYFLTYLALFANLLLLFWLFKPHMQEIAGTAKQRMSLRELFKIVAWTVLIWIAFTLLNYCTTILLARFGIETQQQDVITQIYQSDGLWLSYLLFSSVILGPVVEEFIYRAFYYHSLMKRRWRPAVAALVISVVFALLHNSLSTFPGFFLFSLYLCRIYDKKGYWASAVTHITFNMITAGIIVYNILIAA